MYSVVKFKSGFYGMKVNSTGDIIDAALIKWDGKRGTSYPYNVENENFDYYIDAKNAVYYADKNGENLRVWCPGNRLNAHCKRLNDVLNRR